MTNISDIIGPTATGLAVRYLDGYTSAFVIASLIAAAGVVAMTIFVRRPAEIAHPLAATAGAA